jgi:cobalamin biosynthetic protein CobC
VVLRSFGKFYGLAGLRLGFLLAPPARVAAVAAQLGPWPVSGPALAAGAAALSDDAWVEASKARLADAAVALDQVLERAGFAIVGGTTLFRLVRHRQAGALYDRLGRAGILVRAFEGRPELLRFGLPGGAAELARLVAALA